MGLAIDGFQGAGIHFGAGSDGSRVMRNCLGTDATGSFARGNVNGVVIDGTGILVSGNLVSGNVGDGVVVHSAGAKLLGNYRVRRR